MNKIIKVAILAGALVLIGFVSVRFYRSQVENTPSLLFSGNQFVGNIENGISEMKNFDCANCTKDPEELHMKMLSKLQAVEKNGLVEADAMRDMKTRYMAAYASKFYESCVCAFSKEWTIKDEMWRFERAKWLLDMPNALTPTAKVELEKIKQLELDYQAAVRIASYRSFAGIENAKKQIDQARTYKKDKYLSHCTSLVSYLESLPNSIHNSHYAYVQETIENMEMQIQVLERLNSDLKSKKKSQYDMSKVLQANYNRIYNDIATNMPKVRVAIDDYDTKAQATYGTKKDITSISGKVGSITQKFYSLPRPENE